MKHILNNLSNEEKNRILEHYKGGMSVNNSKFRKLLESAPGNVKPLLFEQETPGVGKFETGAYQRFNQTLNFKVTGSNLFKNGESEIDKNNDKIIGLVKNIKDNISKAGDKNITVTVNGGASNTIWGSNAAGSPEAVKKNKELAEKRRDNLINYLSAQFPKIKIISGNATVGKLGSKDPEKDQFVSIDILVPQNIEGKTLVDRDNTSINYNIYPNKDLVIKKPLIPEPEPNVKQIRVATKVPAKYVDELKKLMYNWAKTKKLKIGIADEYGWKITLTKK